APEKRRGGAQGRLGEDQRSRGQQAERMAQALSRRSAAPSLLFPEILQYVSHRMPGDLHQSVERLTQLQDKKDRCGHGESSDEENHNHGSVSRRKEAETRECSRQPEDQNDQKYGRN